MLPSLRTYGDPHEYPLHCLTSFNRQRQVLQVASRHSHAPTLNFALLTSVSFLANAGSHAGVSWGGGGMVKATGFYGGRHGEP